MWYKRKVCVYSKRKSKTANRPFDPKISLFGQLAVGLWPLDPPLNYKTKYNNQFKNYLQDQLKKINYQTNYKTNY